MSSKNQTRSRKILVATLGLSALCLTPLSVVMAAPPPVLAFSNPTGTNSTFSIHGPIDRSNPFFQDLGSNGRSCETCHQAADGWSITPAHIQARFNQSQGLEPLFRLNDGATSPLADVSTPQARQQAYSLLLRKGLIRVGLGIPANAEFELAAVDDPYHYASATELSLFRRPMPSANLPFLSAVMWDGRETYRGKSILFDLGVQANNATLGHAQAFNALTEQQRGDIVDFETSLYSAQISDKQAGRLDFNGASGGVLPLSSQLFYPGINDPRGNDPTGKSFTPVIFSLYSNWQRPADRSAASRARSSVLRGQQLFNSVRFNVNPQGPRISCGGCHNSPNVGGISVLAFQNTGISALPLRTPDLPLYTLKNLRTNETVQTTDPGRALVTGLWRDIGSFRAPVLRGLAARGPYFHNGSAATLEDVVRFYNRRFSIGLSQGQMADLANFLKSL